MSSPRPNRLKEAAKTAVRWACVPPILPVWVQYQLMRRLVGDSRALEGATQTLAGLPGTLGAMLRGAFLRLVLAKCSPTAEVCYGTILSQPGAVIGDRVYVGPRCHLGLVCLEPDVLLAAGVHVPSGGKTHNIDDPTVPIREQGGERQVVRIGRGAWVGSAAVVLADVGEGTVVGAGSVVTKPLPPNVIAAGVPAKVIRPRFQPPDTTTKTSIEDHA